VIVFSKWDCRLNSLLIHWKCVFLWDSFDPEDEIYPFFSQSDDDLLTKDDNKLEIHMSWLNYPTKINSSSNVTEYWTWDKNNMYYNKDYDYILKTPIKSFDINYNANKLLNLDLVYYKRHNCYNLDEKIERTFLIKKNFR